MNEELIQKLVDQCVDKRERYGTTVEVLQSRKFAELIVRECVQTLIDNTPVRYTNEAAEEDWDKGYDRAMTDCIHHIKEHFGVE